MSENGANITADYSDVGIVVQGPISNNIVKMIDDYQSVWHGVQIIISTWKDEDPGLLDDLMKKDINVVTSTKPPYNGISNVNYQIVSTLSGIKLAQKLGVRYCLKTRTDQRIYNQQVMKYMVSLLHDFPVETSTGQNMRLITMSFNTFKFRLYGITDMFMFGEISDMLNYWDCSLDNRRITDSEKVVAHETLFDYAKLRACEIYLMTEFLIRNNHKLQWTLSDYWSVLKDRFYVLDTSVINLSWQKYTLEDHGYGRVTKKQVRWEYFTMIDWILFNKEILTSDEYEELLYKV